ncbi:GH25 family lysozyme [Streptomyces boncukensis]|uniref:LysM peptidoglycan-binding domain-containing protein n=1 Tax=Streptomyces boncukensis TaxID=2711219 RepID=A0A6G4WTP7_9ACTN|nr:GH25 family lysozyme [Streptomyces boncukensis]NGO68222.1 LysM peptidoglycan-binding domain-containing protein [Streptomyces boncukensis]
MAITGVDVSSYQPERFSTRGHHFAIIKATEGRSYVNPHQRGQAAHARAAGLVVGFYHFLWPGNIKAQAAYFVEKCASVQGDILALDWERTSAGTAATSAEKDQFIREVQRLRGDTHRVILYCNVDFWLRRDTSSFAGDGLWIAHYNGKPGKPGIQAPWVIHQYTDRPVDTNVAAFANREALAKWAGTTSGKPTPPKKPKPTPKPGGTAYTVRSGDTLSGIAARHGLSLSALLAANPSYKSHPNLIHPGDKVKIPSQGSGSTTRRHRIRPGDTLSAIAARYGTTVAKLAKANGISNPDQIYVGQTLKIVK